MGFSDTGDTVTSELSSVDRDPNGRELGFFRKMEGSCREEKWEESVGEVGAGLLECEESLGGVGAGLLEWEESVWGVGAGPLECEESLGGVGPRLLEWEESEIKRGGVVVKSGEDWMVAIVSRDWTTAGGGRALARLGTGGGVLGRLKSDETETVEPEWEEELRLGEGATEALGSGLGVEPGVELTRTGTSGAVGSK